MKRITKILSLAALTLALLTIDCNNKVPDGMDPITIRKHGLMNYLWYKDVCGQDYMPLESMREKY
jgi:hypothetical protein